MVMRNRQPPVESVQQYLLLTFDLYRFAPAQIMATFKPTGSSSSAWSLFSSSFFGSSSEADSSPEYDFSASIMSLQSKRLDL